MCGVYNARENLLICCFLGHLVKKIWVGSYSGVVCMDGQHNSDQLALWKFSSVCGKSCLQHHSPGPAQLLGSHAWYREPSDSASRGPFGLKKKKKDEYLKVWR